MKFSIFSYISLLAIKLTFLPNIKMLGWVFVAVLIDFLTGILKAKLNKQILTSGGFRQTSVKCLQYLGLIIGGIILGNSVNEDNELLLWINDGLLLFIIYVEVYSIFENLYAMNPDSKVSKLVFKPAMRILTIGLEKNSLTSLANDKEVNNNTSVKTLLIVTSILLITGCKVVKPSTEYTYSSKDTTITNYKSLNAEYKGATVNNSINQDSLLKAFAKIVENNKANSSNSINIDSLLNVFKTYLKKGLKDTITVTDAQTKVQLKYWYDEFGKLQMSCTSKDQAIQMMVAEITRLTKEVTKEKKIEVVYKIPSWGWVLIGVSMLITILILSLFIFILYKR